MFFSFMVCSWVIMIVSPFRSYWHRQVIMFLLLMTLDLFTYFIFSQRGWMLWFLNVPLTLWKTRLISNIQKNKNNSIKWEQVKKKVSSLCLIKSLHLSSQIDFLFGFWCTNWLSMFKLCTDKGTYVEIAPKLYILANFGVTLLKGKCAGPSQLKSQQLNSGTSF